MKTRLDLEFFLAKRGRSLKTMCENNQVKTLEQLHALLDDLSVEYPDDETARAALYVPQSPRPKLESAVVKEYRGSESKVRKSGKRSKQKHKS